MQKYLELLQDIAINGHDHPDRTGVGRRSVFSRETRFLMKDGFPIITTRKIKPLVFIAEMLMFITGETNVEWLNKIGVKIWDSWAVNENTATNYVNRLIKLGLITDQHAALIHNGVSGLALGEIGPMYGSLWRMWPIAGENGKPASINLAQMPRPIEEIPKETIRISKEIYAKGGKEMSDNISEDLFCRLFYHSSVDQLNELIWNLRKNPYSSRLLVSAFNAQYTPLDDFSPDENALLGRGALMPCHFAFQCFTLPAEEEGGKLRLSLKVELRSWDVPVGGPFNISGYALLLHMLAHCCDMEAYELIVSSGDTHIYGNQLDEVRRQLMRNPMPLPTIKLNPDKKDLFDFTPDDITIENYMYHPDDDVNPIKYPVAV